MSIKHTPGPWREYQDDHQRAINGCRYVAARTGDICEISGGTQAVRFANARLIAAAPDLLAACEAVAEQFAALARGEGCDLPQCHAILVAAVAKAKGESP